MVCPFRWPCQIPAKKLSEVMDSHHGPQDWDEQLSGLSNTKKNAVVQSFSKILARLGSVEDVEAIIDMGGSKGQPMYECCPCLTRTRTGDCAFWSVKRRRALTLGEMMRLQGVSPDYFEGWETCISSRAMGNIIGNAMTQSVVERIVRQIFIAMGWPVREDRWVPSE